jgi:hypothetical protein
VLELPIISPISKKNANKVKLMCERSGETLDPALTKFGIRLHDVAACVGSWNILATGRFQKRGDTSVTENTANDTADDDNDDANLKADLKSKAARIREWCLLAAS